MILIQALTAKGFECDFLVRYSRFGIEASNNLEKNQLVSNCFFAQLTSSPDYSIHLNAWVYYVKSLNRNAPRLFWRYSAALPRYSKMHPRKSVNCQLHTAIYSWLCKNYGLCFIADNSYKFIIVSHISSGGPLRRVYSVPIST